MSRPVKRASLPGASELFGRGEAEAPQPAEPIAKETGATPVPTGRVKHDQKITVYFSSEELFALEEAILDVRRLLGRSLDRGRFVRTAVSLALADLEANGADAPVVKVLQEE